MRYFSSAEHSIHRPCVFSRAEKLWGLAWRVGALAKWLAKWLSFQRVAIALMKMLSAVSTASQCGNPSATTYFASDYCSVESSLQKTSLDASCMGGDKLN